MTPLRKIIVTPAGRRQYLSILEKHLVAQKGDFDEWHLWLNTNIPDDVAFIHDIQARHPSWVRIVELDTPIRVISTLTIHRFFVYAADPTCTYLRFDDDIVFIGAGCIRAMFEYREAHPEPFLVYGNIINNAIISHILQRNGIVTYDGGKVGYSCMDEVGWKDGKFVERLHETFLADLEGLSPLPRQAGSSIEADRLGRWTRAFSRWHLWGYERVSINCVSWRGVDMAAIQGQVGIDEEQWLSVDHPCAVERPNVILGDIPPCVHFAFNTQRKHLEATDILQRYSNAAEPVVLSITRRRISTAFGGTTATTATAAISRLL